MKSFKRAASILLAALIIVLQAGLHELNAQSDSYGYPPVNPDAWTLEQWTGDNAPYKHARLQIDQEIDGSRDPSAVVAKYKSAFFNGRPEPLLAFSWAAAADAATVRNFTFKADFDYANGVDDALGSAPSPHCYEYARMRFIFRSIKITQNQYLISLGQRLLSVDHRDPEVLALTSAYYGDDLKRSLPLINEAISLRPLDHGLYFDKAMLYTDAWWAYGTSHPEYAHMAVAAFHKFLQVSPGKSDVDDFARGYIRDFDSMFAKERRDRRFGFGSNLERPKP